MSAERSFIDFLHDILGAAKKAQEFTQGMQFEDFRDDEKTVFAVIRALEIIGEAAKRIPDDFRRQHNDIPWRAMAGIRDKLIHGYTSVNLSVVWKTISDDLPPLTMKMEELIQGLSD